MLYTLASPQYRSTINELPLDYVRVHPDICEMSDCGPDDAEALRSCLAAWRGHTLD